MVFTNEKCNNTWNIVVYGNYHRHSISTLQDMEINGDIVLLMDDVTTTGNSLYACKEIL